MPLVGVLLLSACTFGSARQAATPGSTAPPSVASSPASSATSGAPSRTGGSGVASASSPGRGSPHRDPGLLAPAPADAHGAHPADGADLRARAVLFGRYAAWVGCDGCQQTFTEPTTLYVADLTTGRVRAVSTTPKDTLVMSVGGSGRRLVYAVAGPGGRSVQWTAYALDLSDGSRSTLATVKVASSGMPPAAVVGAGQFVWQTFGPGAQGASHGPVSAVDLRTGARRTVSRDLPGVLGAVTTAGLVYRAPTGPGTTIDQGLVDAFLLPDRAGDTLLLSETHDVRDVVADDTTAAWQTNDGPDAGVWAAPLDGQGPARQFYRGGSGDRAVGTGFVALVTAGDAPVLLLYPLGVGPVVAVGDVPEEFDSIAAEGARLAYIALPVDRGVQPDAKHPIALVVDTVTAPGR